MNALGRNADLEKRKTDNEWFESLFYSGKYFLFPSSHEINPSIIKDETPVEYRVTLAIGGFQKSLPFVSNALLHTAITFGQKLPIFPKQGSPMCTDRGEIPPTFDEREIGRRLGSCSGHRAMIRPLSNKGTAIEAGQVVTPVRV